MGVWIRVIFMGECLRINSSKEYVRFFDFMILVEIYYLVEVYVWFYWMFTYMRVFMLLFFRVIEIKNYD